MRKRDNFVLAAVSVLIGVSIAEGALRFAAEPLGFITGGADDIPGLWIPDELLGFRPRPGFSGRHVTRDFAVEIAIDSAGFRAPRRTASPTRGFSVLVVGNSLAFGWGVSADEAWPAILESGLRTGATRGVSVFNGGVSGYNVEQAVAFADRELRQRAHNLIVLEVYAGGVDRMRRPYALVADRFIVRADVRPRARPHGDGLIVSDFASPRAVALDHWLAARFRVGQIGLRGVGKAWTAVRHRADKPAPATRGASDSVSGPVLDQIVSVIAGAKVRFAERGSELVVVIAVTPEWGGSVSRFQRVVANQIGAALQEAGVDAFSTLPVVEAAGDYGRVMRFEFDGHWNARGHAEVGANVAQYLTATGYVPSRF